MSTDDRVVEILPKIEQILAGKRNVSCSVEGCAKTFLHEGMLKMHLVKSHGLINNESDRRLSSKIQRKASDTKYNFFCPEKDCKYASGGKHFTTFHLLKQHYMKMHAEKKFFCYKCEKGFSEQRFLRQHEEQCGNLYTCGSCPVFYTTREALMTHCTRQRHIYPEDYKRKDKEREEKRRSKSKIETETCNDGTTFPTKIPVLLLAVEKVEPAPKPYLPSLLPKPKKVNNQCIPTSMNTNEGSYKDDRNPPLTTVNDNPVQEQNLKSGLTNRQEVMVQTDIYGIWNLSVSGTNHEKQRNAECSHLGKPTFNMSERNRVIANGTESCSTCSSCFKSPSSPKGKQKALKRRCSYPRPASPRRKKIKTTTGIQTSVSLTQRRRAQIVNSTQTTGDLILRRAMAEADIPIQKRTVGSQVTPNKSRNNSTNFKIDATTETKTTFVRKPLFKDSFSQVDQCNKPILVDSFCQASGEERPLLVDSFSQVRQGNIIAETSELLAERQTMTDMPESISTQTFQSFLGDRQNHSIETSSNVHAINVSPRSEKISTNEGISDQRKKGSTVEIFDDSLDKSVKIHVPIEDTPESNQSIMKMDPRKAYLEKIKDKKNDVSLYNRDERFRANDGIENNNLNDRNNTGKGTAQNANQCVLTKPITTTTQNVITSVHGTATIDNEAQAMSAEEFVQLLQASGFHLGTSSDQTSEVLGNNIELSGEMSACKDVNVYVKPHHNFYDFDIQTIDTNTQTAADFDLFESIGAIDMNTQTTGNGIDFLDLVMNNMETQTLNDDDLESLGLENLNSNVHSVGKCTLEVCTTDVSMTSKATSPRARFDDTIDFQISIGFDTQSLGIGTSDFEMESDLTANDLLLEASYTQTCNTSTGISTQTGLHSSKQLDGKVKVQSETQTTGCDAEVQLVQTETQTQIVNTDFDVTNMETQTTFDEFCDWLI